MATTTQRTVQIPLHAWAIFCTAVDSDAVPQGEMRTFTRSLLGTYFPATQTNGAAGNAAQANQREGASQPTRKASNASKETIAPRTVTRKARSGSRREQLFSLIRATPEGMARGEIIKKLGVKDDKSGEMSVSNALTAMKKANLIRSEGGRYSLCTVTATAQGHPQLADA